MLGLHIQPRLALANYPADLPDTQTGRPHRRGATRVLSAQRARTGQVGCHAYMPGVGLEERPYDAGPYSAETLIKMAQTSWPGTDQTASPPIVQLADTPLAG